MATRETFTGDRLGALDLNQMVDPDAGRIGRAVYVEPAIYELEMKHVFARAWLFLGHETQLREPGDYLTTFMGEDPVILVRGADGEVRAFLNACRHRGMRVCRAEEGNTSFFRCPYHAWTYSNQGDLRGVPKFRQAYEGVMNKEDWGLLPVAKVQSHQGLIFGTWEDDAPDLTDYLGDFTTILDLAFGRDPEGVEVIGGAHKWTIDSNWKHPADNFACDMYHVPSAHQRSMELGLLKDAEEEGFQLSAGAGYVGNSSNWPVAMDAEGDGPVNTIMTQPSPYTPMLKEQRKRMAERFGEDLARLIPLGHSSTFPNFSFLDLEILRLIRVQQPLGPEKVMVHQWCAVDRGLPPEVKTALRKQYELTFGPAGLLEQDDGENWRECQNGMRGHIGRSLDTNAALGLGREGSGRELHGPNVPGHGGGIYSEVNQRQFYRHWLAFMGSDSWSELGPRLAEVSH